MLTHHPTHCIRFYVIAWLIGVRGASAAFFSQPNPDQCPGVNGEFCSDGPVLRLIPWERLRRLVRYSARGQSKQRRRADRNTADRRMGNHLAVAMKTPGDDGRVASLECLDQRLELHAKRFVVRRYGRDFAVYMKQLVDGHLGRPHRILHREDNIVRNFDKLADEREIA